jgi:hypothetical protein
MRLLQQQQGGAIFHSEIVQEYHLLSAEHALEMGYRSRLSPQEFHE